MDDWCVVATQVRGEGSGNTAVYCKCHKAVRRLQGLRVYTQIMQSKVHNINECLSVIKCYQLTHCLIKYAFSVLSVFTAVRACSL